MKMGPTFEKWRNQVYIQGLVMVQTKSIWQHTVKQKEFVVNVLFRQSKMFTMDVEVGEPRSPVNKGAQFWKWEENPPGSTTLPGDYYQVEDRIAIMAYNWGKELKL
jgi:hypothetical protein